MVHRPVCVMVILIAVSPRVWGALSHSFVVAGGDRSHMEGLGGSLQFMGLDWLTTPRHLLVEGRASSSVKERTLC